MTQPTHKLNWDVMLPINGTPVLFTEFLLECALEQGTSGPYVQAVKLCFDTGIDRRTQKIENEVVLDVLSDHATPQALREAFEDENWSRCFDILLAFMVSQQLKEDEMLLEKIS